MRKTLRNIFCVVAMFLAVATGACSYTPTLNMQFEVRPTDLPEVMEILVRYAQKEDLTVLDVGAQLPPKENRRIFLVKLRRQGYPYVTTENFLKQDQMIVSFYVSKQDARFQEVVDALLSELRQRWPDIHV